MEDNLEHYLCPACGVPVYYQCRLCGSTRSTNQVSGNVIWMRNGRVLAAFKDSMQAWVRMAAKYQIPEEDWPPQFQSAKLQKNSPEE